MDVDFGGRTEALDQRDGGGVGSVVLRAVEAGPDRLTPP